MTISKSVRNNLAQNDGRNYTYDAFISFSEDDNHFVQKECIPILEEQKHFKLCIHTREFTPGRPIWSNITACNHESKNVICIITKSFLKSNFCNFELEMAITESLIERNGKNIVILVFYENLKTADLNHSILKLNKKFSFIQYTDDKKGNIVFWRKLQEAMT